MPGVVINVRWPTGMINGIDNTGPYDHYRHWMEQHVGRQGWDWNWGLANNDASENRLTIKFRHGHQESAVIAKMMWS